MTILGTINFLQAISAVAALASGIFWIRAALIKIPWPAMNVLNGPAPVVMIALRKQTFANAVAAWAAGVSGIAAGVALLLPRVADWL